MSFPAPAPGAFALITGASQGIGEAIARQLAAEGHNLILVARRQEVLQKLGDELSLAHGIDVEIFAADLSKARDVDALVKHINDRTVSICVNSAGIASFGPFMAQDWEYETNQFNLNATAVFRITKAVLDQMVPRGDGALCNVGSAAGNLPIPNNATYVFTKAGVNQFTEALHYELKDSGVHVTLLAPVISANAPGAGAGKLMWTNLPASDLAQRGRVVFKGLRTGCSERDPHRVLRASGAVLAETRDVAVLLQRGQLLRQGRI